MRALWCLAWLGVVGVVGVGASSGAEPPRSQVESDRPELEASRQRGELLFRIHCASCHGSRGRGDGPLADDLEVAPADLTALTERGASGEQEFPAERIARVIDGREALELHGGREMPVWGLTFQDAGRDTNQETVVSEKIADLIEHLRTLQTPDPEVSSEASAVD